MKKIMLSLLTISLIGTTVMPVYAADVYGEETTNLYSYNEGAMYDDDHVTEYSADVEDEKLQQNFEAAINDGIGLSTDDFHILQMLMKQCNRRMRSNHWKRILKLLCRMRT